MSLLFLVLPIEEQRVFVVFYRKWQVKNKAKDRQTDYEQNPEDALLLAKWLTQNTRNSCSDDDKPKEHDARGNPRAEFERTKTKFV